MVAMSASFEKGPDSLSAGGVSHLTRGDQVPLSTYRTSRPIKPPADKVVVTRTTMSSVPPGSADMPAACHRGFSWLVSELLPDWLITFVLDSAAATDWPDANSAVAVPLIASG